MKKITKAIRDGGIKPRGRVVRERERGGGGMTEKGREGEKEKKNGRNEK